MRFFVNLIPQALKHRPREKRRVASRFSLASARIHSSVPFLSTNQRMVETERKEEKERERDIERSKLNSKVEGKEREREKGEAEGRKRLERWYTGSEGGWGRRKWRHIGATRAYRSVHRLSRDNDPSCLPLPSLSLSIPFRSSSIAFSKNLLARLSTASFKRIQVRLVEQLLDLISGDSQLRDALSRLNFLLFVFSRQKSAKAFRSWLCFSSGARKRNNPKGNPFNRLWNSHTPRETRSRSRITSFPVNFIRKLCLRFFPFFSLPLLTRIRSRRGMEGEKEREEEGRRKKNCHYREWKWKESS